MIEIISLNLKYFFHRAHAKREPISRKAISIPAQILQFVSISGVGWLIDFGCYILLAHFTDWNVGIINMISAVPAITFVFFTSTIKTFINNFTGIPVWLKYVIYLSYQFLLLILVSYINFLLFRYLHNDASIPEVFEPYLKLITKILITPITMTCNFLVLKKLLEFF